MSIDRLAERLNFSDDTYDSAVENLSLAIEQMNLAAGELDKVQITSALQPEQLAYNTFLRQKQTSTARISACSKVVVAVVGFGAARARGSRELLKWKWASWRTAMKRLTPGGGSQQNQQEIDKLEELARRQEGLTRAQRNLARREDQMTEEQKRRELERLMRQQEQLSREVAQLAQQMSRGQQSGQSSPQNGSQSQSASGSVLPLLSSAKVPFSAQHSKCRRRRKATLLPSRRRAARKRWKICGSNSSS